MATVNVPVHICDVCQRRGVPATAWTLTRGGDSEPIKIDLCDQDARPLTTLLAILNGEQPRPRRTQPRTRVVTMAEIEALKRAR